jgi:Rps23 Pro-64 3,4-dihydroxylase Tpa1-like proline 4-hydroxylase
LQDRYTVSTAADLADIICCRLRAAKDELAAAFGTPNAIRYAVLDRLLPDELALRVSMDMPPPSVLLRRSSPGERKYVSAAIDALPAELRSLILAFNHSAVVRSIGEITAITDIEPDEQLYNGGITIMGAGDYMCPHLDNSHDFAAARRRKLALIYYLTPRWKYAFGGQLELWDDGPNRPPHEIAYCFNRLVLIEETLRSWHSVRPVVANAQRTSITAYYYSRSTGERVRLTRFRGRPGQVMRNLSCTFDFLLRSSVHRVFGNAVRRNQHLYVGAAKDPALRREAIGGTSNDNE